MVRYASLTHPEITMGLKNKNAARFPQAAKAESNRREISKGPARISHSRTHLQIDCKKSAERFINFFKSVVSGLCF